MERVWENKQKQFPQTSALQFLGSGRNTLRIECPVPCIGRVRRRNETNGKLVN